MILYNCDKCGVDIGLNEPYIAITHNKEVRIHNIATQKDYIEVKDSKLINVLCGKCGNKHSVLSLSTYLKQAKTRFVQIDPVKQKTQEGKLHSKIDHEKS